eukprot:863435-Pyramimonas_sp.AAC.1
MPGTDLVGSALGKSDLVGSALVLSDFGWIGVSPIRLVRSAGAHQEGGVAVLDVDHPAAPLNPAVAPQHLRVGREAVVVGQLHAHLVRRDT